MVYLSETIKILHIKQFSIDYQLWVITGVAHGPALTKHQSDDWIRYICIDACKQLFIPFC